MNHTTPYVLAFETMCDDRTIKVFELWAAKEIDRHEFLQKLEMIMESHRFRLNRDFNKIDPKEVLS